MEREKSTQQVIDAIIEIDHTGLVQSFTFQTVQTDLVTLGNKKKKNAIASSVSQ